MNKYIEKTGIEPHFLGQTQDSTLKMNLFSPPCCGEVYCPMPSTLDP